MGPWPPVEPGLSPSSRRRAGQAGLGHRMSVGLASWSRRAPTRSAGAAMARRWMFCMIPASIRCRMETTIRYRTGVAQARLSADDWADAALRAIGERGLAGVAVEPLAAQL